MALSPHHHHLLMRLAADRGQLTAGLLALASAACFGAASALQHRGTRQVAYSAPLAPGLLLRLVQRPLWLAGIAADLAGLVLQVFALHMGSLVLVAPLLTCGLLVAVPLGALLDGRRLSRGEGIASLLSVAGLTGFLAASRPSAGLEVLRRRGTYGLTVSCAVLIVALLLAARAGGGTAGGRSTRRGVLLGAAGGLALGGSAALIKSVTTLGSHLGFGVLTHPAPYCLVALGAAGLVLSQNAFQAGPLGPTLAVLTLVEPVVDITVGLSALREQIATSPVALVAEVLTGLLAVAGVTLLSIATERADAVGAPLPSGTAAPGTSPAVEPTPPPGP